MVYTFFNTVKAKINFSFLIVIISAISLLGCSKSPSGQGGGGGATPIVTPPPAQEPATPNTDVFMQAFYWNVTPGGIWWDSLQTRLDSWKSAGITALWLPVISKGASGGYSMGYDPYDYFDFGQYNQMGTVSTRFGSKAQLFSLLTNARAKGFKLIADIVINHNSGGANEYSPYLKGYNYTNFNVMSGKFVRNYEDFHPSAVDASDEGTFGGFPDICHNVQYVKDWLYGRADGMAKYYRDSLGFSGWRFDYVKGYSPNVVKAWDSAVGGISIGEFYDANLSLVTNWVNASGSGAFDYPLYFSMINAFNGNNLTNLDGAGLISVNSSKAYTFAANHDIDNIYAWNKMKAYAYILTAEGTPFIFYPDYEWIFDKTQLNALINIHKTLAAGTTTKLFSSSTEYIFRRNGTPGLIAYFNTGTDTQRSVQTVWANATLKDYTGINPDVTTDASGMATIPCKANSYSIYSKK